MAGTAIAEWRNDMDKIGMVHRDSLSCEAIVRKLPDGSLLLLSQCGGMGEPCPENRAAFRKQFLMGS